MTYRMYPSERTRESVHENVCLQLLKISLTRRINMHADIFDYFSRCQCTMFPKLHLEYYNKLQQETSHKIITLYSFAYMLITVSRLVEIHCPSEG